MAVAPVVVVARPAPLAAVGLKDFLRLTHITLMVKHLCTLANRVLQTQQTLSCAITRIQRGFLPHENAKEAQRQLQLIATLLREMEEALQTQKPAYTQVQKVVQ